MEAKRTTKVRMEPKGGDDAAGIEFLHMLGRRPIENRKNDWQRAIETTTHITDVVVVKEVLGLFRK